MNSAMKLFVGEDNVVKFELKSIETDFEAVIHEAGAQLS